MRDQGLHAALQQLAGLARSGLLAVAQRDTFGFVAPSVQGSERRFFADPVTSIMVVLIKDAIGIEYTALHTGAEFDDGKLSDEALE